MRSRKFKRRTSKRKFLNNYLVRLAQRICNDLNVSALDLDAFVNTAYYYVRHLRAETDTTREMIQDVVTLRYPVSHKYIIVNDKGRKYKTVSAWSLYYLMWLHLDPAKLYLISDMQDVLAIYGFDTYHPIIKRLKTLNAKNAVVMVHKENRVYWGLPTVIPALDVDDRYEKVPGQLIYNFRG